MGHIYRLRTKAYHVNSETDEYSEEKKFWLLGILKPWFNIHEVHYFCSWVVQTWLGVYWGVFLQSVWSSEKHCV